MENTNISYLDRLINDVTFDMDPEEVRTLGYQTVDLIVDYFKNLRQQPILPRKTFQQIQQLLNEPLPKNALPSRVVLDECQQKIIANTAIVGHPRLLGWMLSSGTTIGAYADGIAGALNQNVAVSGSTVATTVELLVLDWIKQILGYDPKAAGILVSGGSVANLTALTIARNIKAKYDVHTQGMAQYRENMIVYVSEEAHHSIQKAAQILGIGTKNIRWIPVDTHHRMDVNDLKTKIIQDTTTGNHPFCVVATAGTVQTGTIDPLEDIADLCQEHQLWFHVDAAYGGFAALSDTLKPLLNGINRADSIVLDPHKWLFIPIEAGCVLVKDASHMRQTFAIDAPYIHSKKNISSDDEEIYFSDYGIQLSRQFRALKIWMSLKQYGVEKYRRLIEQNVHLAQYLEALIRETNDFQNAASVGLSTVCFRYFPEELQRRYNTGAPPEKERVNTYLSALNRGVIDMMRIDGRALLSGTVLGNNFVLRACIMNYRTTKQDIRMILDIIRELAMKKDAELRPRFF